MHVDEDVTPPAVRRRRSRAGPGRPIDVTLRSSPPGAQVAVDGTVIGNTPSFWSGNADGREHEFVFTMRGYAIARYRFVPVTSGVIHGRLDPIHEDNDAGVPTPPPEVVPPRQQPRAVDQSAERAADDRARCTRADPRSGRSDAERRLRSEPDRQSGRSAAANATATSPGAGSRAASRYRRL